jgi:hypothetical protein
LVTLEALDAPPERQVTLRDGYELAGLAVIDGLVPNDGQGRPLIARLLAELETDGWIAWEWTIYAGDPQRDQPPAPVFDEYALRKVRNLRITPEGYAGFAVRRRLDVPDAHAVTDEAALDSRPARPRYDLFISHASEDKDAVARPLARALTALGFSVWFDEDVLEVGDRLRPSIDAGLARSQYGVVVLSRAFFAKPWPPRELDGLFGREVAEGAEIILPLWHDIDQQFLAAEAPMLLDRLALRTDIGATELADRLSRRLRRERGERELALRAGPATDPPPPPAPAGRPASDPRTEPGTDPSPIEVRAGLIAMLRAEDSIGLRELLRYERREFDAAVLEGLRTAGDELGSSADPERLRPLNEALWQAVDRRLGSLLPLVEYQPEALVAEITALAELAGRAPATRAPFSAWLDGTRWPVWLVTLILGTVAVALDAPAAALALWGQPVPVDSGRPLPAARLRGGAELGQALTAARGAHVVGPVELWYPAFAVHDSEMLRTYYGEIRWGGEVADPALGFLSRAGDFLWLCGALAGRDRVEMIKFWAASQVHPTLPDRLDPQALITRRLAQLLGLNAPAVPGTLTEWLETTIGQNV